MTTIYVTVAGIVVPCEVTKTTTCFDVIRMFTSNSGNSDHAMFESTSEKEILLSMKSSALKVVSSWGAEWFRKSLVIRPEDAYTCRLASMSRAQRILYRLTHGRKSSARRVCTGPRREAVTEKYCASTAGKPDEVLGKQDIMSRFFHNVDFYSNRSTSQLNAEHDAEAYKALAEVLLGRLRDEDMDRESVASRLQPDRMRVTCLDSEEDGLSDSGSDVSELNKCFVAGFNHTCNADFNWSQSESAFCNDSDCSSVGELEKNVL
ncbi:hypothetical protein DPMN_124435 [Dreissena polymorpha]|uniref:Uncharacterized protein n=1 Tax=Dreissena polymorpha TaxID=45954 RepID=A0A9D4GW16_DREPO|nr:hypothetical protein DPMN_124435 [Dreissena polymorpha]